MARYCKVALDIPLRSLFDYHCPSRTQPMAGVRVRVPFGNGTKIGVVQSFSEQSALPAGKIKPVLEVLDPQPLFDRELLELLRWAADYYHHPPGEVLFGALPAPLRKGGSTKPQEVIFWRRTQHPSAPPVLAPNAHRQRQLLEWFHKRDELSSADAQQLVPRWRDAMNALEKKGLVERLARPHQAVVSPGNLEDDPTPRDDALPLNAEQQKAYQTIRSQPERFAVYLLHGVTGSGKTEIYLQLAARVIASGGQVLVLIPEIGLTGQILQQFQGRFGAPVTVLHSGLSDRQRNQNWLRAYRGDARIVLGTRSAVFSPLPSLRLIIVDEEQDPSYKQQEGFRYHARDLAVKRAQRLDIPVVLGSATPSLESWHNASKRHYRLLSLPQRAAHQPAPEIRLLDARHTRMNGLISAPLLEKIRLHLERGKQVLLFLNRRGFAPILLCHGCGQAPRCARCQHHYTLHLGAKKLVCHHCAAERPLPGRCNQCAGTDLIPIGAGTERIEAAIRDQFPEYSLLRIDRDTTRGRGALEQSLETARAGEADILLGTQMLAKGHHFPGVTLVAVLDGDQGLFATDFRASERLVQTLFQVAGRSGRTQIGEVIVQTHSPEHPLWNQLLHARYEDLADYLLGERKAAQMPPYTHLALLRASALQPQTAIQFLAACKRIATQHPGLASVQVLGPVPAPMEKRAGRFRAQLLLNSDNRNQLQKMLRRWIGLVEELPQARTVRWSLDVDPADMY